MSVTDVREIWHGRSGGYEKDGVRTYTREFQVICSSMLDGPLVATGNVAGLPALYSVYATETESDYLARCQSIDVRNDDQVPWMWFVTCKYSSQPAKEGQEQKKDQPPQLRPWDFSWTYHTEERTTAVDFDGHDIKASNGLPFDPGVTFTNVLSKLKVSANVVSFNPLNIPYYVDSTNSDFWQGYEPGTLLCTGYAATSQVEGSLVYWRLEVEFLINLLGFDLKVVDAHTIERIPVNAPPVPPDPCSSSSSSSSSSSGSSFSSTSSSSSSCAARALFKYRHITDEFGHPVTKPWPLKADGSKADPQKDPIRYLTFALHDSVTFKKIIPGINPGKKRPAAVRP